MNNDELQKAIDDITNSNAAAEAAPVADAAVSVAENEQLANEIAQPSAPTTGAGVDLAPVAPEAASEVDLGTAPAPVVPETPAMPPAQEAAVEATPVAEPVAEAPAASDDATLNEAYKELYPLLDKVEMPVEEKFEITMKFGEPSEALALAKNITDEAAKAKALMKIIEKLK